MDNQLMLQFQMEPGGRTVQAQVFSGGGDFGFEIIPADVVAFVAGVNIGSVIKVFAALELMTAQAGEILSEAPYSLYLAPVAPPDDARKENAARYIRALLQSCDTDEAQALEEFLRLGQRVAAGKLGR